MMLFVSISTFGATKQQNDTISINQDDVSQWIAEEYKNTKGETKIHYYAVWKGNLCTTSRTVIEKAQLCKKYKAHCALIAIGKRTKDGFKPKRIALN